MKVISGDIHVPGRTVMLTDDEARQVLHDLSEYASEYAATEPTKALIDLLIEAEQA